MIARRSRILAYNVTGASICELYTILVVDNVRCIEETGDEYNTDEYNYSTDDEDYDDRVSNKVAIKKVAIKKAASKKKVPANNKKIRATKHGRPSLTGGKR